MQTRPIEASIDAIVARIGVVPFLVALVLVLMIPGFFTLPPMDRDEPRFAQASKQMLETSDFVAIRFGAEARNKKPVGIHWLQAAAVGLGEALDVPDARRQIWLYRLPSLVGALCAVLLTYWAALPMVARNYALLAAMFVAATPLLGVEGRLATTDAVLTASVAAAMGALARVYLVRDGRGGGRFSPAVLFWAAVSVGLLIKGPINPLVVALAAAVLSVAERSARWLLALRPLPGAVMALLLVSPWFVLILLQTKGAFFADAVGHDPARQGRRRPGRPRGAARLLLRHLLADRLAARALRAPGGAGDLAGASRTRRALPPGLGGPDVAGVRDLPYEARPLCPADLPRAGDPGGLWRRAARDVVPAVGAFGGWVSFGLLALVPSVILALVVGGQGRLWTLDGPRHGARRRCGPGGGVAGLGGAGVADAVAPPRGRHGGGPGERARLRARLRLHAHPQAWPRR